MSLRMGYAFPVLGLGLFLAACDATMEPTGKPGVEAVLNEPFWLAAGQTAVLAEEGLSVSFLRVLEDGRCPVDVLCISAGNATISIQVKQQGKPAKRLSLTLYDGNRSVAYEGFGIHLQQLMPDRILKRTIRPEDYSVQLLVDRP